MSSVEQARKILIDSALNEIRDILNYSNFCTHTYYVIAKLGLQRKAKVEKLFETIDWDNGAFKEVIFKKIKSFLTKHIK